MHSKGIRTIILALILFHTGALQAYHPEASRALHLSRTYDTIRAIKVLHSAFKKHPKDDRLSYRLAYLFHTMNRRQSAQEFYLNTIAIKKCHARAHNNLGNIYLEWGKNDQAIASFMKASQCQQDFALPRYNLGNLYRKLGQLDKAAQYYNKTLQLDQKHRRAHHNIALVYIRQLNELEDEERLESKQASLALRHINAAIKLAPRDAISYYNRGRLFESLGSALKARHDYKRCLDLLPETSNLRLRVRKKIKSLDHRLLDDD